MGILIDRLHASLEAGRLGRTLPADWGGFLADLLSDRAREHLREPLNGQRGRVTLVEELLRACGIEAVLETGTYHGSTARWFGERHLGPVITFEASRRNWLYARSRLLGSRNVDARNVDSRDGIQQLVDAGDFPQRRTLAYLDAHWNADLPLGIELKLIARHWAWWVAVIDDFAVPGDPGYRFDDYGPAACLAVPYVQAQGIPGLAYFFPRLPSEEETSHKRGCVVLSNVPEAIEALRSCRRLREWRPTPANERKRRGATGRAKR